MGGSLTWRIPELRRLRGRRLRWVRQSGSEDGAIGGTGKIAFVVRYPSDAFGLLLGM